MSRGSGLLALALLLSACAGTAPASTSDSDTAEAERVAVEYVGGQVRGDTGRITVAEGATVTITVTSDVADEAHLHGYDVAAELRPGTPAELTFDATIPGVFELELHEADTVLLTLQVG